MCGVFGRETVVCAEITAVDDQDSNLIISIHITKTSSHKRAGVW